MSSAAPRPVQLDIGAIRGALGDVDTSGIVLFTIALWTFGDEVMGNSDEGIEAMDPSEMWAEFHSQYGTWVPEEGENKLNAIIAGLQGGAFWIDLTTFMSVTTALFDGDLGDLVTGGFEDLNATEIMWSVLEMELAWDSDNTPDFSLDVREYIEDALRMEQEDQVENSKAVEKNYLFALRQMQHLGVPNSIIREWDEEYAEVTEDLEDATIS